MKLTRVQHARLWQDCYAEYPEGTPPTLERGQPVGGAPGVQLRAELRAGRDVSVTPYLIAELEEFADRDAEPAEQRMYRRLLAHVKASLPCP